MGLVGCFVSPHPPIIVPEVGGGRAAQAAATIAAMRRLGVAARELAPDVIVIMSPHAGIDPARMGVSVASSHQGSLAQFGAPQVQFSLRGQTDLAEAILEQARSRGVPAVPVTGQGGTLELDHGCLVPLSFIVPGLATDPSIVVLSFSFQAVDQHVAFGEVIGAAIDASSARVLYIASGDLSHRLTPDAPAGYAPRAADFDRRVVETFSAADGAGLLQIPTGLQHEAGECGYRSLVTLFGLLRGRSYRTSMLSYEGPWGVGYMVGMVDLTAADPLVELARHAVETWVNQGREVPADLPSGTLPAEAGVFVSLHRGDGSLRGCLGTLGPTRPSLAEEIVGNAVSAASRDRRFAPVRPDELPGLHVSVDVLNEPEEIEGIEALDPRVYGLIVRTEDGRQALLLPDLEGVDTADQQLRITCRKGHIDPDRDRFRLFRFTVTRHS